MTTRCAAPRASQAGAAVVRRELDELAERLGCALPWAARPGADLLARSRRGVPWPPAAPLLRTADGWVHPGPPTAWSSFAAMVTAMGAPWPELGALTSEEIDAEAAAWMLPATAVRARPARPDLLPDPRPDVMPAHGGGGVSGASVVVLGTAWAAPLVGHLLAQLGARVVKVAHPRRPDPFPLAPDLERGFEVVSLDLGVPADRDRVAALITAADLLVVGHPPRVLGNAGIAAPTTTAVLHLAAFAESDRPGYGPAAEAHGGWAARHDPPRLGRTSVADPVAGMVGAVTALALLAGTTGPRARISLEGAVGRLLARERLDG